MMPPYDLFAFVHAAYFIFVLSIIVITPRLSEHARRVVGWAFIYSTIAVIGMWIAAIVDSIASK